MGVCGRDLAVIPVVPVGAVVVGGTGEVSYVLSRRPSS